MKFPERTRHLSLQYFLTHCQPLLLALMVGGCSRDLPTAAVAVPTAPVLGAMMVDVSGLPADALAPVTVTGPNAYHRAITSSIRLDSLVVGDYVVRAGGTLNAGDSYGPTVDSQLVHVSAGPVQTLQVTYLKLAHPASTNLPAHPRVWMDATRLAQLRAQASASTVRWQRVKSTADAQVAKGAVAVTGDVNYLPDLCLAYLGSGNTSYATRAGVVLTTFAVEADSLTTDSGYDFRFYLPLVVEGLDWCYNGLTAGQRHQAATWMMNRADWVWPETNPVRKNAWAVTDVGNNYYWGFMMSGPAALAAAGDDTLTGPISGADRPTYHQQLVLNKWNAAVVPFLATRGAGGAWPEGSGYDSFGRLGLFADAFTTAGTPITNPTLTDALRWRLASTLPGGGYHFPIGDQARVSNASTFTYDRVALLDLLGVAAPDNTVAAASQYWLNLVGQAATSEFNQTGTLADELLRYNSAAPAATDFTGLLLSAYASGSGLFSDRQSWTDPNATAWVFQSGPYESHNVGAANSLRIWKGSFWVSADANIYSASGINQASQDFNTLTVGGVGQTGYSGNDGSIIATQVSDSMMVVQGQAANTYGYPRGVGTGVRPVTDYLRTVAYLPARDAFVVVDRITVLDPSQPKVWRWHTQGVPAIAGNTFTLTNPAGAQRCFGTVLLPTDATLGVQSFAIGSTIGQVSSNAVTVTLPTGRASDVVATVLQCTATLQAPWIPTVSISGNQVIVTIGTSRVTVSLVDGQSVGF